MENNLYQIFKILEEIVKKSAAPLKETSTNEVIEAIPESYWFPEDFDDQSATTRIERFIAEKSSSQPSNNRIRNPTTLVGEVLVSFNLPDDFPMNEVDIDKQTLLEKKRTTSIAQTPRRYSFTQRLKGWKVEQRQRENGRYDKFYHHLQSNTQFRSVVAVVNFLLYEEYPNK